MVGGELLAARAERGRERQESGVSPAGAWMAPAPERGDEITPNPGLVWDLFVSKLPRTGKKETQSSCQPDADRRFHFHKLKQRFACWQPVRASEPVCASSTQKWLLSSVQSFQPSPRVRRTRAASSTPSLPAASFHGGDFSSADGPFRPHPQAGDARARAGSYPAAAALMSKRGRASTQLRIYIKFPFLQLCPPLDSKSRATTPQQSLAMPQAPRRAQKPSVNTKHASSKQESKHQRGC